MEHLSYLHSCLRSADSWVFHNHIKIQRAIKDITQEELAVQIGVTRKQSIRSELGFMMLLQYWF
ncbi:MAG: hypothetical protein WCL21_07040 [Mariniphaga sp.]